jgi:hypothetical protein
VPTADLLVSDEAIELRPIAEEESFCGGAAVVPNVYGEPIDEARPKLQQYGWEVAPGNLLPLDVRGIELRELTVIEVEGCSGTGFGFCFYLYAGQRGKLTVMTAGEIHDGRLPLVAGYAVDCAD